MSDINNLKTFIPDISTQLESQFLSYFSILNKYNATLNLIARSTIDSAGEKHFADSYWGLKSFIHLFSGDEKIYDFGSGNGFPGIIAALIAPTKEFVLVERDQRKAEFLKTAIDLLKLSNVKVFAGNSTDIPVAECFLGMSRAMAPLPRFLLETRSAVKPGGKVYIFKSDQWTREMGACPAQIFEHWDIDFHASYKIASTNKEQTIICCQRL